MFEIKPDTQKQLELFLRLIVQNKQKHAHWLNTLAFLEHIGSRKIIKSQDSATLNFTVLQHISEEARHAFYFKKLARQVSKEDCPNFQEQYLIKGAVSEDYFQSLDHKSAEELSKQKNLNTEDKSILNYLYTTWLIEERAIMLYNIYNDILKLHQFPFNLNMILHEEDHHLKTIMNILQTKDKNFKERANVLFQYEQTQFEQLLQEWMTVVSS